MIIYKSLESLSEIYLAAEPLLRAGGCRLDFKQQQDLLLRVGSGCQNLKAMHVSWLKAFSPEKPIDISVHEGRPDVMLFRMVKGGSVPFAPPDAQVHAFIPKDTDTKEDIKVLNVFWNMAVGNITTDVWPIQKKAPVAIEFATA
jgi:hypothetical protein